MMQDLLVSPIAYALPGLLAAADTIWRFLGETGGVMGLGMAALGSSIGIGVAGQAAAGAWAKEARAGRNLSFTYIILVGMPISQTLYAMIVMVNMRSVFQNLEVAVADAGLLMGVGLAVGMAEMLSAWMQGLIGAAGVRALSDGEGKGLAFIIIAMGIVETVGIFAMVFLLGMIPGRVSGSTRACGGDPRDAAVSAPEQSARARGGQPAAPASATAAARSVGDSKNTDGRHPRREPHRYLASIALTFSSAALRSRGSPEPSARIAR